ncbi:MAG: GbsR/MarR family transcriptional regulator [Salinibacter sp.]|uniref:GbsR/MarR family transcriptional regulator n=1 Tax=Salinibacter sp. TaxID=2065818 RepID=UPI0035D52141
MSHSKEPSSLERELIEEIGNIYEDFGLRRLQGLIVGLLLTKDDPVSLDDMVEILDRSKGPISISVRRLDDMGLVRKVEGPNNRRNYYASHPDIFFNNFKFSMATVRKNRDLAERFLARVDAGEGGEETEKTSQSLERMKAFYDLMETYLEDFAEEWREIKQERLEAERAETEEPAEAVET